MEYACRAGTTTPFHFGDMITTVVANYDGDETTPVGAYPANAYGLCDMHGNVDEWCADHWHSNYDKAPTDGSPWLTENSEAYRVLRGGSWIFYPRYCHSASRYYDLPGYRYKDVGFRVVAN